MVSFLFSRTYMPVDIPCTPPSTKLGVSNLYIPHIQVLNERLKKYKYNP